MASAEHTARCIERRISDIDSIIKRGNEAFKTLEKNYPQSDTVWFMDDSYDHSRLYKKLSSYGEERNRLQQLIEFYENIGIEW